MDTMRRTPQAPERRPVQSTDTHTDVPQSVGQEPPKSTSRRGGRSSKGINKKILLIIAGVIIAAALIAGGLFAYRAVSPALVDGGKYQAVFLSNGQVYFGKLDLTGDYYVLTDIYYLQAADTPSTASSKDPDTTANDIQLIKLGTEIHGPDDQMVIAKDQVLFFENLKDDSTVVKSIKSYQDSVE